LSAQTVLRVFEDIYYQEFRNDTFPNSENDTIKNLLLVVKILYDGEAGEAVKYDEKVLKTAKSVDQNVFAIIREIINDGTLESINDVQKKLLETVIHSFSIFSRQWNPLKSQILLFSLYAFYRRGSRLS